MDTPRRHRVTMLALFVFVLGGAIGLRLYHLQVLLRDDMRARADRQSESRVEVIAPRGAIVDRSGEPLSVSLETESLIVHPWKVEDQPRVARTLAPVIGKSRAWVRKQLASKTSRWLGRFMSPDQVRTVLDLDLPIGDGQPFEFLPESKRYYPLDRLGVHVIGFANIDGVGVEGIERQFDEQLRGDSTVWVVLRDARNGTLRQAISAPGRTPRDVVLSLDIVLQHVVERELDRAMRDTRARAASAVLLDPATGQILALANRPAANPNRYGKADPAARINRAVVHEYEPGSTFKIVSMAAALELGAVRPGQRYNCERGSFRAGTRTIRDISPHRSLTALEIIQKSSNIGMAKIVEALEPGEFHQAIRNFGFGSRTGVELPGERTGTIRPVEEWDDYSRASISFGQEIGVTVLQMTAAFGAVANDGVLVPPRTVLGYRDADGELLRLPRPEGRRVVSRSTVRELTAMLESVITAGTGTRARVSGYRLAGKSGTAQKFVDGRYSDSEHVASFGGFGPVGPLGQSKLACLVVLDSPEGGGGEAAAPVFASIMTEALRHLRIPSDSEWLAISSSTSLAAGNVAR